MGSIRVCPALLGGSSWTPEIPSGKPIQSSLVSSYCKGYILLLSAWQSEYLEGLALPISVDKVYHLVDSLTPSSPPTLARLVVERNTIFRDSTLPR